MTTAILIAKLLEIERSVAKSNSFRVRAMVLEAQGCVLELEQQLIQTMGEMQRLRERMENCERSRLAGLSEATLSKIEETAIEISRPLKTPKNRGVRRLFSDTSTESIN
ncbi:MAG: hypothetical protein WA399_13785 [Acidobacteriaceae bacterium]